MILRAIRLQEVGCFRAPTAVEGLSEGLNVLAEPNEAGKSTLFRAVWTLFSEKHTARGKRLEAMLRPHGGGAPLIEVDFEVEGRLWRMRKRFFSGREAVLSDLGPAGGSEVGTQTGAGAVVARGADAEVRLAALIGADRAGGSRLGLLWLAQGKSLEEIALERTEVDTLSATISHEVGLVAGSARARRVRARVAQALDAMVTEKTLRPKAGTAYAKAIAERDRLKAALAEARSAALRAEGLLERLREAREARAALMRPDRKAERERAVAEAEAALGKAQEARDRLKTARERVKTAEMAADAARERLAAFIKEAEALEALAGAMQAGAREQERARERVDACETAVEEARAARDGLAEREQELKRILDAVNAAEQRRAARARLEERAVQLEVAEAAHRRLSELRQMIAALGVSRRAVDELQAHRRAVREIEARLAAGATRIEMRYGPGGAGRVRLDGRALGEGETVRVDRPLRLEIEGIGALRIAPGASGDLDADRQALEDRRQALEASLARLGLADVAEAEAQLAEREEASREAAMIEARLKGVAPQGLDALKAEVAQLERLAGETAAPEDLPERAEIARELEGVEADREKAAAALDEAREALFAAREGLARIESRLTEQAEQFRSLEERLGDEAARAETRAAREAALEEAEADMRAAVRQMQAWAEKAPEPSDLEALEARLERLRTAEANARREAERRAQEIAEFEGALGQARQDGISERAAELEGALARAERRVARFEEEVEALSLLAALLDEAAEQARDAFMAPVLARLDPYLKCVFPEARLAFGEGFSVAALERAGTREEIARLSDGTREQIAVLVRLGFAKLFADRGMAAPLILDDALVYSDDRRIERVFDALALAARSHQVIVLTCRARSFEGLGGTRLRLSESVLA